MKVGTLKEALDLKAPAMIALVGAGGKTTLMFRLANELVGAGHPVITTTTTRIYLPGKDQSPCLLLKGEKDFSGEIKRSLARYRHLTIGQAGDPKGKVVGLDPRELDTLFGALNAVFMIVEADGSKGHPLKAPAPKEPVIPQAACLVIPMLGLSALGKPLDSPFAFRPEILAEITDQSVGSLMTRETLLAAMVHPRGLMKNIPPRTRIVPFLNQLDRVPEGEGDKLAEAILKALHPRVERVVIGKLKDKKTILTLVE